MLSTIKDSISDFFLYIKESFSEMRARPWTILKYGVVWPILLVLGFLMIIVKFFQLVAFLLPEGEVKHPKTIVIYRDNDDW